MPECTLCGLNEPDNTEFCSCDHVFCNDCIIRQQTRRGIARNLQIKLRGINAYKEVKAAGNKMASMSINYMAPKCPICQSDEHIENISSLLDGQSQNEISHCEEHKGQETENFCMKCTKQICRECAHSLHNNHQMETKPAALERCRKSLCRLGKTVNDRLKVLAEMMERANEDHRLRVRNTQMSLRENESKQKVNKGKGIAADRQNQWQNIEMAIEKQQEEHHQQILELTLMKTNLMRLEKMREKALIGKKDDIELMVKFQNVMQRNLADTIRYEKLTRPEHKLKKAATRENLTVLQEELGRASSSLTDQSQDQRAYPRSAHNSRLLNSKEMIKDTFAKANLKNEYLPARQEKEIFHEESSSAAKSGSEEEEEDLSEATFADRGASSTNSTNSDMTLHDQLFDDLSTDEEDDKFFLSYGSRVVSSINKGFKSPTANVQRAAFSSPRIGRSHAATYSLTPTYHTRAHSRSPFQRKKSLLYQLNETKTSHPQIYKIILPEETVQERVDDIIGMTFTESGKLALLTSNRLTIINLEGTSKTKTTWLQLPAPNVEGKVSNSSLYGICSTVAGNLATTDQANNCIRLLAENGSYLRNVGMFLKPHDISSDANGNFVVMDTFSGHVYLLNNAGDHLRRFRYRADEESGGNLSVRAGRVTGSVLVNDGKKIRLYDSRNGGKLLNTVESENATAMDIDHFDNIIVAGNGKINLYSSLGKFCSEILTREDGIGSVKKVAFCRKNMLLAVLEAEQPKLLVFRIEMYGKQKVGGLTGLYKTKRLQGGRWIN